MKLKISIGLIASLLVAITGLLVMNIPAVSAAGSIFIGTCGNCGYGPIGAKIASQLSAAGIPATSGPFANGSQASNLYADIPGKGTVKLEDYFRTSNPADGAKIELGNQSGIDAATKAISDKAKPLQDECIFMEGGNVNETFSPTGGVKTAGTPTGFGKYNPADPFDPLTNSPQNIAITLNGENTYQQRFKEVADQANKDNASNPGKKTTIYTPNAEQTLEAMRTGKYTVNGVKVGGKYVVGKKGTDGITVDENCNPTQAAAPKDPGTQGGQPFAKLGGSPGSGAGAGGGGGLGGLSSLLPLLMSGMLGGGNQQGNLANQNAQNQYNQQNQCSYYGVSPVCGSDGKSYNNSCYLQQYGVVQVSTGACAATTPTPQPTPNVASIVTQLVNSGVPAGLIESVVSALNIALAHIPSQVTVH